MQKREIMNISWIRPRSFIITIYCEDVLFHRILSALSLKLWYYALYNVSENQKFEQNQDNQEINENSSKGNNKHKDI